MLKFLIGCSLLLLSMPQALCEQATFQKPNILWIIPDDMSAHFSCYGESAIETPNVDRLAKAGVKFTDAVVTAPVCSTCRSAFITGMYQTSIGAHHHRSGRGRLRIRLQPPIKMVPELFQDAGYYTSISGWPITNRQGKTDYNFEWDPSIYDGVDWADRKEGQPFFAQIMTPGGKLRGKDATGWEKIANSAERAFGNRTPDSAVSLPPYYPNHPDIIRDWAAYLDSVRMTDLMVGQVLDKLKQEGDLENTLVIFMTDHGISHARGKQFLYEEGIHIPLVIAGPGVDAGTVREDPVEHIDIAALSLAAAGIKVPDWMQAQDILANNYQPREAVYSARDRCDETVDHIRSVRTNKFKYIRNYLPERPYLQPNAYKDAKAILIALKDRHTQGKLNAIQSLQLRQTRPPEELYDLEADSIEVVNLASDPEHQDTLVRMRGLLDSWVTRTSDQGAGPEDQQMFESDMSVYLERLHSPKFDGTQAKIVESNIDLMKRWAAEGK